MPLVDYLNRKEMQALLDAPNPNTREGVRDRAMLHVVYAAGLRVSELVGLRLDKTTRSVSMSWAKAAGSGLCLCGERQPPRCALGLRSAPLGKRQKSFSTHAGPR